MRFLVAVACLVGALALASPREYHGYQVLSVVPRSAEEVELVRSTVDLLGLDQWSTPKQPGVPVDVLVPGRLRRIFLTRINDVPREVKIEDVQSLVEQQRPVLRAVGEELPRKFDHTAYHDINSLYSILEGLEAEHGELVSSYTAGTSYEGRPIIVNKVTSATGSNKPVVWIDCGIHAREWIAPATCMWVMDKLTSGYGTDSEVTDLMDTYEFHILTSANPDGYAYTWSNERFWRKNRVPYGNFGCHGTDPNRNFDSDFGGPGTSNSPCSDIYHGPSAFSEVESSAIRDSVLALGSRVKVFFTIHAYSQLWMTPYGYTSALPANYNEQYRVSGVGVDALYAVHGTVYQYGNIADTIYPAAGGSTDWAYDKAGVQYAFALEMRDTGTWGFLLPASQIIPVGEETWAGIVASIKAI